MYTERTVREMKCDYCKKSAVPHPEADGSLGLVKGWYHYDPAYMHLFGIRPYCRVDFCSAGCRDSWLEEQYKKLQMLFSTATVVYQFSADI